MTGKPEHWERAQVNERGHWEGLISGLMKGPPDYGGERFWLELWQKQGRSLWSLLKRYIREYYRILEVGGGVIGVIRWLKEGELYALDPLGELFQEKFDCLPLSEYEVRRDVFYGSMAIEDLGWVEMDPFHYVLMFDALDHCRDPEKALGVIHAVLEEGGCLLEATTAFHFKFETSEQYQRHHPWAWTKDELMAIIQGAGFDLMSSSDQWPVHPSFRAKGAHSDQVFHIWRKINGEEFIMKETEAVAIEGGILDEETGLPFPIEEVEYAGVS